MVCVRCARGGYGSIPAARRRSSLASRCCWRSLSSIYVLCVRVACYVTETQHATRNTQHGLLYFHDRQLHHARGSLHGGLLLGAFAEQRGADRRLVRDLPLARLRLGAADDRPGLFFVLAVDPNRHRGADPHLVALAVLFVDELGARENALDLADTP